MEKKKSNKKIVERIILIIGVIVILYLIYVIRNAVILSAIDGRIAKYENSTNLYKKVVTEKNGIVRTSAEIYFKDGVDKTIFNAENGKTMIQIDGKDTHKIFIEPDKKASISKGQAEKSMIANFADSYYGVLGVFKNSLMTLITTEEVNGKECYKITGYLDNFIVSQDIKGLPTVYIEKDTGLAIKYVENLKDGTVNTINYEYKFNVVTDDDLKEPDISEYDVQYYN